MEIRTETARDRASIRAVNEAAFATSAEADLVDTLRARADPLVSLVAEEGGTIIGHILFSPVSLTGRRGLKIMALAPMAVLPERQREGVGSALVRAGLRECSRLGFGAVVVLGHPGYYPRFGFVPGVRLGIGCEYEAPKEAFMVLELENGYLAGASGDIEFHAAFRSVP